MSDCCGTCKGMGFIGWFSLAKAGGAGFEAYAKEHECPKCKGSGGWKKKPKHRMTLDDLREMMEGLS